jgi:hypothetical protein
MQCGPIPAAVTLLAILAAARADGAFVTVTPAADTSLIEFAPTNNHGAQEWVNSGTTQNGPRNRGLFRFDLTVIPATAVIISAELVFSVTGQPVDGLANAPFGLYRMLRPWGEGDKSSVLTPGQGLPASPGEATWLHSFYPTNAWSAPGGAPGVDFHGFESAFQFIYGVGESPYRFESTPELVEDVQGWVNAPESNFGWMLLCDDEDSLFTARRFASREDANNAPVLEVEYVLPPRIEHARQVGDEYRFSFTAEIGVMYRVEFRDSISPGDWQTLTNVFIEDSSAEIEIIVPRTSTQRFFRLALSP